MNVRKNSLEYQNEITANNKNKIVMIIMKKGIWKKRLTPIEIKMHIEIKINIRIINNPEPNTQIKNATQAFDSNGAKHFVFSSLNIMYYGVGNLKYIDLPSNNITMNTFGRLFRVTTWGESHGNAIGCVVDGCPSGLELSREEIQAELDRRRPGQSAIATPRTEEDRIEILSGVFEGKTLGTPISMLIRNKDVDSSKYEPIKNTPRPGHGDFTWREKFSWVDWRGGGRNSARETAARVAAGAVAKKLLQKQGINVIAYSKEIGGIKSDSPVNFSNLDEIKNRIESNPVRALEKAREMEEAILSAKEENDSVGGIIEAIAVGVPPGLGEPVFSKLDSDLTAALMGIPAVKGVEIGAGFQSAGMKGSESNDEFVIEDNKISTRTNNCGGVLGGISTGMPIVLRAAVKPTSSIGKEQETVNLNTMEETTIRIEGRHDPCIVPRAVPVVEAMASLVLADHSLLAGIIPGRLD